MSEDTRLHCRRSTSYIAIGLRTDMTVCFSLSKRYIKQGCADSIVKHFSLRINLHWPTIRQVFSYVKMWYCLASEAGWIRNFWRPPFEEKIGFVQPVAPNKAEDWAYLFLNAGRVVVGDPDVGGVDAVGNPGLAVPLRTCHQLTHLTHRILLT